MRKINADISELSISLDELRVDFQGNVISNKIETEVICEKCQSLVATVL